MKFLYVASMILMVFPVLALIVPSITGAFSGVEVVGSIVFVSIFAFVHLLMIRVLLELVVVVFRIGETATETRDLLSKSSATGAVE